MEHHNCIFYVLEAFFLLILAVASACYYATNVSSYVNLNCYNQKLVNCSHASMVINWYLTCFLLVNIAKNIVMSVILFISLYRFYDGLRKINLEF